MSVQQLKFNGNSAHNDMSPYEVDNITIIYADGHSVAIPAGQERTLKAGESKECTIQFKGDRDLTYYDTSHPFVFAKDVSIYIKGPSDGRSTIKISLKTGNGGQYQIRE